MPGKVDCEKQRNFLSDTLKPAIAFAKSALIELFFVDASHFVMGGVPGRLWSKVRLWVKTGSGRKRYNVLGALNYISGKIETVTNDTYITAVQVVELLDKLAYEYAGKRIVLILDNAKYQRCATVISKAVELNIELVFLPTYSPNLNLIERVWKFVKANVLSAAYIETFDEYRARIDKFVGNITVDNAERMSSLITEKFQLFDDCKVA